LALVPAGAAALIFLYPTTDKEMKVYLEREEPVSMVVPKDTTFLRQIVGGTCGTIAVVHAVANALQCRDAISPESPLAKLLSDAVSVKDDVMGTSQRFVNSAAVRQAHQWAVSATTSANSKPAAGQRQGRHFLAFVNHNGHLLELDGRRAAPVCRRPSTSATTFLRHAAAEVKGIVSATQDPSVHVRCSLMALVPSYPSNVAEKK